MGQDFFKNYVSAVSQTLDKQDFGAVRELAVTLQTAWKTGRRVFVCGNGGSAANAMHLANDLLYGISKKDGKGLRVTALPADSSVITCLANDLAYDQIFSAQLKVLAEAGDVLIVLSGSGNSPNVVNAVKAAKSLKMKTAAVLGYSGGECLKLADIPIHFAVNDMQIAEDMQLIVGHMLMRWLCESGPAN